VVLRCYGWLLDPDNDPQTDDFPIVVNNSWGYQEYPGECPISLTDIIDIFENAGVAMVFAAGNSGPQPGTSISPANNSHAFAVGGTTSAGSVMISSSRGPSPCDGRVFPDIAAPGQFVNVLDAFGPTTATGTSFAAPHVSGAMALLASALPNSLKNDEEVLDVPLLKQALTATARDIPPSGVDNDSGSGELDILAAYGYLLDTLGICRADMNGDRQVDQTDYDLFSDELESGTVADCYENYCPADFNLDGRVDLRDLAVLRKELGSICPLR